MNKTELLDEVNKVFARWFDVPEDAVTFVELEWTPQTVILKTSTQPLFENVEYAKNVLSEDGNQTTARLLSERQEMIRMIKEIKKEKSSTATDRMMEKVYQETAVAQEYAALKKSAQDKREI